MYFSFCKRSTTTQRAIHPFQSILAKLFGFISVCVSIWDANSEEKKNLFRPFDAIWIDLPYVLVFWFYALIWCHWYIWYSQVHQKLYRFCLRFSYFSTQRLWLPIMYNNCMHKYTFEANQLFGILSFFSLNKQFL